MSSNEPAPRPQEANELHLRVFGLDTLGTGLDTLDTGLDTLDSRRWEGASVSSRYTATGCRKWFTDQVCCYWLSPMIS